VSSQNLTLNQLLELKKKDIGNAEEYLTERGWEFFNAEEPTFDTMGKALFTYNKNEMSERAESFLTFLYSEYSERTRISIQINKKMKYTEYINSIKSFGCKLISSKIKDGEIVKIYRGATTTFKITSSTSTNFFNEATAVWHLFIVSNDDFDLNFGEE
jgi:hypothetical protein